MAFIWFWVSSLLLAVEASRERGDIDTVTKSETLRERARGA